VNNKVDIIKDISLLYELSLSVGTSIDLKENATHFLQTLISRKNLTYASIWIKSDMLGEDDPQNCLHLLMGIPAFRVKDRKVPVDHPICRALHEKSILSLAHDHMDFGAFIQEEQVEKGAYALFRLGHLGILKLYDHKRNEPFSSIELNQLRQVVEKLTVSLRGNIGQLRFQQEFEEKSRYADALKANEKRIRSIINSALDAVITIDHASHITEWNKQAEQIFGWEREEVMGKPLAEIIIPHNLREAHTNGMKNFYETGHGPVLNNRIEVPALHRTGRHFPVELAIVPIKIKDEYAFSAFIRDITDQKEAEEKREKLLKQLEKANRELQDFAYIVSHDLKAPLRAIGSLAHWLEEDYGEALDQDGMTQLQLLQGRVKRMHELINGILDYSRVGRTNTEAANIDLEKYVRRTIELIAPPTHIKVNIVGEWPHMMLNKVRIQQVFQNLIGNGVKYMDKEQGEIEVGAEKREKDWLFWIKDNGPGIDEKYFEKVFRIFQTLNPRDEIEGTGIGLSIVKKIINLYQGEIWVTSELGTGSTFFFTLPHNKQLQA